MKKQDTPALRLEKQTLTAWAQILHKKGMIDAERLEHMITLIGQMTDSGTEKQPAKQR